MSWDRLQALEVQVLASRYTDIYLSLHNVKAEILLSQLSSSRNMLSDNQIYWSDESHLGIYISLSNFSDINYDMDDGAVTIGVGVSWGDAYDRLDALGLSVDRGQLTGHPVGRDLLRGGLFYPRL